MHLSHLIDTIKTKDVGKPPHELDAESARFMHKRRHFAVATYKIYHIMWFAGEYRRIQGRERPL